MVNDDYFGSEETKLKKRDTPVGPVYVSRTGNGTGSKRKLATPEPLQRGIEDIVTDESAGVRSEIEVASNIDWTKWSHLVKEWSGMGFAGMGAALVIMGAYKGAMDNCGLVANGSSYVPWLGLAESLFGGIYGSSKEFLNEKKLTIGTAVKGTTAGAAAATLLFVIGYGTGYISSKAFN